MPKGLSWASRRPATAGDAADPLARFRQPLAAVTALEPRLERMTDDGLRRRGGEIRRRVAGGEDPAATAAELLALTREAARRALGLRPYDVQIAAGLALAADGERGAVIEMMTGEGKTLAAVAPVALHALAGRGAHVLTFNDYLARRDAAWMGPVYELLGLSVGHVQEGMAPAERRRAYARDVTYLTAKEAGFDFLRDGLCLEPGEQVQRPFHFALVDEADSILIDEARIPLILAGAGTATDEGPGLGRLAEVARRLTPDRDWACDDERRNVYLTATGSRRAEELLGCADLYAADNAGLQAALRNALHAESLLRRDVDYIVRRGAVELVDELTGRVAENRQWPDGLHAAVEAKEGLTLGADGVLLGSITLQHFLRLYPRLRGMTATAAAAGEELAAIYDLEVVEIPSHRPCVRRDEEDLVFARAATRDAALLAEIERVGATGRPILVGTASVAESERLATALDRRGITCRVLNAKNDEQEAAVVADAGAPGAVTISTNMAGRGTDIRLGGRDGGAGRAVRSLGGLYVIGTNLHESRRIDRQLRGRAGRQGDPGSSRFFLSLEDDLPRRCGIERLIPARHRPTAVDGPVASPVARRELARAQRIVEGECFDVRRRLYDYSRILDEQRDFVRSMRQAIVDGARPEPGLDQRRPERWRQLVGRLGEGQALAVERRLALLVIDRAWGEYLTDMQTVRDEMHLVTLDGRQPLAEFYRVAIHAFERLRERIDELLVDELDRLVVGEDGVDWDATGLRGPAATWTYLVSDNVFGNHVMGAMANRASIGLWGSLLLWWLLIPWGLYLHWKRRRKQRELDG